MSLQNIIQISDVKFSQYDPDSIPLNVITVSKGSCLYIPFVITEAGVVPCGGPKKPPSKSCIVQSISLFSVLCGQ